MFSNGSLGASPLSKTVGKVKNSASDFAAGNRVEHPQYGIGTIVGLSGAIADIAFSGHGIKKMNVEFAPIRKI